MLRTHWRVIVGWALFHLLALVAMIVVLVLGSLVLAPALVYMYVLFSRPETAAHADGAGARLREVGGEPTVNANAARSKLRWRKLNRRSAKAAANCKSSKRVCSPNGNAIARFPCSWPKSAKRSKSFVLSVKLARKKRTGFT